jgi:hypothetical protein
VAAFTSNTSNYAKNILQDWSTPNSTVANFTSNTSNYAENILQNWSTAVSTVAAFTSNTSNSIGNNSNYIAGILQNWSTPLSTVATFTSNTSNYAKNILQDWSTAVSTVALFTSNSSNSIASTSNYATGILQDWSTPNSTVALFTSNTSNYLVTAAPSTFSTIFTGNVNALGYYAMSNFTPGYYNLNLNKNYIVDILIVGGGGGGGTGTGYVGGGGGGGFQYLKNVSLSAGSCLVQVGNSGAPGNNGENSYVYNSGLGILRVGPGGGSGGNSGQNGANGGCGGGGGQGGTGGSGFQGFEGGNGNGTYSADGGGMGSAGNRIDSVSRESKGKAVAITGSPVVYSAGGYGGYAPASDPGPTPGIGNGGNAGTSGSPGIVIIRFYNSNAPSLSLNAPAIGINTDIPAYTFDVNGSGNFSSLAIASAELGTRGSFSLDVNGYSRGAIYYSSVTAGGTMTIQTCNYFGVYYDIKTAGTYTLAVVSGMQPASNLGKYYTFRNNTGADLSVTFSGGSGITSPFTIYSNASATIVVATTSLYALF